MHPSEEHSRNLPHFYHTGATYFVTFRLHGSVPVALLNKLKNKYEFDKVTFKNDSDRLKKLAEEFFQEKESIQEQIHSGPKYLEINEINVLVKDQLHRFDQEYYDLICYCIMCNHVHVLLDTSIQLDINNGSDHSHLNKIMKRIKGPTALYANKVLNRSGRFWQEESYDHYIRNEKELNNIHSYILENPVIAGLVSQWDEWPHSFNKYSIW